MPPPKDRPRAIVAAYQRKERFARSSEREATKGTHEALVAFRRQVSVAEVERAIVGRGMEAGRDLMRTLPWDKLDKRMRAVNDKTIDAASRYAAKSLRRLPDKKAVAYDVNNTQVATFIGDRTGQMLTLAQKDMTQVAEHIVSRGRIAGLSDKEIARQLKAAVGLNPRQAVALSNYRTALAQSGVPPRQAMAQVRAYGERLLVQRATMTARTDTRFALNHAEQQVYKAAGKSGALPRRAEKQWVVDGNPCPELCLPMDGVRVGIDESFTLPDGRRVDVPPVHLNCACSTVLVSGKDVY